MKNSVAKFLHDFKSFCLLLFLLVAGLVGFSEPSQACATIVFKTNPPEHPRRRCDCPKTYCRKSPCYVMNGNYVMSANDLQIPTRGFPIGFGRNYDTMRAIDGLLGIGWSANVLTRLTFATYASSPPATYYNEAVILMPDGIISPFRENPDGVTYQPPSESHDTLVKNPDGSWDLTLEQSRSRYHFASNGSLTQIVDDYGNSLNYLYDGNGRLDTVSDGTGSGRFLDLTYGPDGRISSVQDSAGRSVQFGYSNGTLTTVTDAEGRTTTYSYTAGRFAPLLSRITDHWGRIITDINYDDAVDKVITYMENGETFTYTYDPVFSKTKKEDTVGNLWWFTYDVNGQVTRTEYPIGSSNSYASYYPDGSLQQATDEMGVKTYYTYNSNGSVASINRDYQGSGSTSIRFDYTYDANFPERVTAITPKNPSTGVINRDWQEWKYDYYQSGSTAPSALHHLYRVKSDGTQQTIATYTYNSFGQIVTVTDATGSVTTYAYHPTTSDLLSITYPKNSISGPNPVYQYGRDSAGRVTSVTDPLGKITSYIYDDLDRITSVTLPKPSPGSPLDFVTTYSYDNYDAITGLVFTHQTDANGKVTKQGYDQYGRLGKSIDALNNVTTFTYAKDLLDTITDANGNQTGYGYTVRKWLGQTIFPDGTVETYIYDKDGLLDTKTNRKNQQIKFSYDGLKRLTNRLQIGAKSFTYTYVGQKLTRARVTGNPGTDDYDFTYDSSYRVQTSTQASQGTITHGYDAADRVASYSVTGGPTSTYTYYADGSLNTITWSLIGGQFQYNYTLNGQYGSITFPNGQHRDYTYDDQRRLTQISNIHPQTGNLATYAYDYDTNHYTGQSTMLGQRSSMNATVPSQSFNNHQTKFYYDSNYQLTKADYPNVAPFNGEIDSWTYDPIGNRLTNTLNSTTQNYTYYKNGANPNNGQRLQSDGTNTYTFDNNGNTITKTGGFTYGWDFDNQMTSLNGPSLTTTYEYDYLGRRGKKVVNGATTNYLYQGQNLIREMGTTTGEFLFGPGIDEPLAMVRSGVTYYYNADGLGSINVINDAAGTAQNKYVLDAWGLTRTSTTPTSNPFTYTARESSDAGLMYYRARYYNPIIGRFISEDPIAGPLTKVNGFWHSFSYVDNDSINWTDVSGLAKWRPKMKKIECRSWIDNLLCEIECNLDGKRKLICYEIWIKKDVIEDGKPRKRDWRRPENECVCTDPCEGKECVVLDAMKSIFDTGTDLGVFGAISCGAPGGVPAPAFR